MDEKDVYRSLDKVRDLAPGVYEGELEVSGTDTAPFTATKRFYVQVYGATLPVKQGLNVINWVHEDLRAMNGGHMEGQGNAFRGSYQAPRRAGGQNGPVVRRGPRFESALFKKGEDGGAKAMFVLGLIGAIGCGALALLNLILRMVGLGSIPLLVFLLVAAASLGIMSAMGSGRMKRMERYERYRALLEEREFARVSDLAAAVGLTEKQVKADLKSLIRDGYFKQAHFDAQEKNFIVSDDMYRMYQVTEENAARLRREAERKEAENQAIPPAVREILDSGQNYIQRIHKANDNIPDRGISDKLDRMEAIVTRIFDEVRKNPALAGNLEMFMDYYLPTTIKLVEAYEDMDKQNLPGENVRSAKAEISVPDYPEIADVERYVIPWCPRSRQQALPEGVAPERAAK